MPRYFFHTVDGGRERDTDGVELSSPAVARVEAIRFAGEVLTQDPDTLWDGREFRVEVVDEQKQLLFTIVTMAIDAPASGDS